AEHHRWKQLARRHRNAAHDARDNGVAVDRLRDGLAHPLVLERVLAAGLRHSWRHIVDVVEMQIDDARREPLHDLVSRARLDALQILDGNVLDQVDIAGEERGDARTRAGDGPKDDALPLRLLAPVVVIALKHDAI